MVNEEQNFAYDSGQVNEELSRFTIFQGRNSVGCVALRLPVQLSSHTKKEAILGACLG